MKCGICNGRKVLHAGNGVKVPCTGCKGAGSVKMTIADRVAAKRERESAEAAAARAPRVLRFVVDGHPVPKGRPRFSAMPGKGGRVVVRTYTPEETEAYETKVKEIALGAVNQAGWCWSKNDRFHVLLTIVREHEGAGGDLDNYGKIFLDGLNGVTWKDDRYVRGIGAFLGKPNPDRERVVVEVRRVPKDGTA